MKTKTIFYILGVSAILLVVIGLVQDLDGEKNDNLRKERRHIGGQCFRRLQRGWGLCEGETTAITRQNTARIGARPGEGPEAPLSLQPHM